MTSTILLIQATVLSTTQAQLENVLLVDFLFLESQTRMTAGFWNTNQKMKWFKLTILIFISNSFFTVYLLFKCRFVAWSSGLPREFACCVLFKWIVLFWTFMCFDLLCVQIRTQSERGRRQMLWPDPCRLQHQVFSMTLPGRRTGRHFPWPLLLSHLLQYLLPFWSLFLRTRPCLSSYDPADCQLLPCLSSPA